MLSSVFRFWLLELQDSFVLWDLVRSFELEHPRRPPGPPAWDLVEVLEFLRGPTFEPLHSRPLRVVIMKVLFLLSLATTKRVEEEIPVTWHILKHSQIIVSPNSQMCERGLRRELSG